MLEKPPLGQKPKWFREEELKEELLYSVRKHIINCYNEALPLDFEVVKVYNKLIEDLHNLNKYMNDQLNNRFT